MNVEITALADANLQEIHLHIREDSRSRADEWRKGLVEPLRPWNTDGCIQA